MVILLELTAMRLKLPSKRQSDFSSQWRIQRAGVILCLVMGLLLMAGTVRPVQGQLEPTRIEPLSPTSQAQVGARLVQANRVEEALPLLHSAMEADSALVVPEYGAAAYWLGRAYAQAEQPEKAHSVWRRGLHVLRDAGAFDLRLADAYLKTLTPVQLRGERLQAVDVYRSLFRHVGTDTSAAVEDLYRRRVAQIAPLVSDDVLGRIIEEDRSTPPNTWTFQPGAGSTVQEWWRGLDPLSSTSENERLEEHLARLVHVQQNFRCSARTSALDERGLVYLRFGSPYKRRPIDYEDGEFLQDVYRRGVSVTAASFPESEIWLYTHIDEAGFYLFAEPDTSDCFLQARANDLIPSHLTMRRGRTERGLNIAYSALMAMRAIYRELALYHINFSGRYNEIADYASRLEMGSPLVGTNTGFGIEYPTNFVPRMVMRARREDRVAAERRRNAMPRQYTTLLDNSARLPVAVRTARFLNDDGTTRTEIYWGVSASDLALGDEGEAPSTLTFSVVRYDRGHQTRQQERRRYQMSEQIASGQETVVPPVLTLEGTSDLYHLGLQWGQYRRWPTDSTAGGTGLGPKRRMATARADSMQPLRARGPGVEMSDVKVLSPPDSVSPAAPLAELKEQAAPYPFRTLTTERPLLLNFEVYHLTYDADDRTRYTISYEAEGRTQRGWKEIFLGEDTQRTSTEMTVEGTERMTDETILLDLSQIEQDDPQNVRVTVHVTDEVTGTTVSRDLQFELQPREASN